MSERQCLFNPQAHAVSSICLFVMIKDDGAKKVDHQSSINSILSANSSALNQKYRKLEMQKSRNASTQRLVFLDKEQHLPKVAKIGG